MEKIPLPEFTIVSIELQLFFSFLFFSSEEADLYAVEMLLGS